MPRSSHAVLAALTAALLLQGCSSRPRSFNPVLHAAPTDEAAFQTAHSECTQLIAQGENFKSDRVASGGAGAAAGLATGAAGTAVASGAAGWGGLAVMGATVALAPFAKVGGAWGMAKAKKQRKERAIKEAGSACLAERGYEVADWEPAAKEGRDEKPVETAEEL
jgi:hypothetical protein